jgi:1,4-alpha-glucan branching enzyme
LFCRWKEQFAAESGSFLEFVRSYKKFGLNINADGNLEYREWAPSAREVSIVISYA